MNGSRKCGDDVCLYVYIHNGILLSHKKKEILTFAATWVDEEGITLNKISQRKTNSV